MLLCRFELLAGEDENRPEDEVLPPRHSLFGGGKKPL